MQGLIRCPIYPTEDQERIHKAINNIIIASELTFEMKVSTIEAKAIFENKGALEWLRNRIHELRIIDAVRTRLRANWDGKESGISLDKQAAYHGRIKLLDDREELPPLGCIKLQLEFDSESEFENFLRFFTPPTKDGRIVS